MLFMLPSHLQYSLYTLSAVISFEANTTPVIEPYYLSYFKAHSMLSTAGILTSIAYAVAKPPLAKMFDVIGRAECLFLACLVYCAGYTMTAFSHNVVMYMVSRLISAFGGTGLSFGIQILIADTSSLSNRGLLTSTSSLPWIASIWLGPLAATGFLRLGVRGYRMAYLLFGLLVPTLCLPLIINLQRTLARLKQRCLAPPTPISELQNKVSEADEKAIMQRHSWAEMLRDVWQQVDMVGIALLTSAVIFLLLPLSLAATTPESWGDCKLRKYC